MKQLSASARKLKLNREQNAVARSRLAGTSLLSPSSSRSPARAARASVRPSAVRSNEVMPVGPANSAPWAARPV